MLLASGCTPNVWRVRRMLRRMLGFCWSIETCTHLSWLHVYKGCCRTLKWKGQGVSGLGWLRCWEMQSKEAVKQSLCTSSINAHEWRLAPLCLRADQVTTAVSDIMPDVFQGACCPPLGIPPSASRTIRSQSRTGAVKDQCEWKKVGSSFANRLTGWEGLGRVWTHFHRICNPPLLLFEYCY